MKVLCIVAAFATFTGTAFADDDQEGQAPATPDPATMTPAAPGSWAMEIIDRPLTLKAGMLRVQGDLGILRITIPPIPPATESTSSTGVNLLAGAGYGVSDKLEVGGSYGISLKEFEAKGPLSVYALFQLADGKLKAAPGASFTYNLLAERASLAAGLAFQYNLTPKIAVFMPPAHLSIGLDPTTAAIDLPVGVMLQATPNVNLALRTSVATIGLEPSGSSFIGADRTPLVFSAFYSPSNKMDFGATIDASNLPDIADVFVILLTGRLFVM